MRIDHCLNLSQRLLVVKVEKDVAILSNWMGVQVVWSRIVPSSHKVPSEVVARTGVAADCVRSGQLSP